MDPEVYCVDFECFYDTKRGIDIDTLGAHNYVNHPDVDIYLASVCGPGVSYVGEPQRFDWSLLRGKTVVAHNMAFDIECLEKLGVVAADLPDSWNCSANLSAYLHAGHNLRGASQKLLGRKLRKEVIHTMDGVHWCELMEFARDEVRAYALADAESAQQIYANNYLRWPEHEQALSRATIQMCRKGIAVDRDKLEQYMGRAQEIMDSAAQDIPWRHVAPILSQDAARFQCLLAGIPAPASFAQDDEACAEWENKYGEQHPFVAARRRYSKANRISEILQSISNRIKPDGRLRYDLKYFGTFSGRWNGTGGLNMLNFPRGSFEGIDLRTLFTAPEGKKLLVADLSQIEPRILAWICHQTDLLEAIAQGYEVYEAQAKAWNLWSGAAGTMASTHKALRQGVKNSNLGCGYGMAWRKFRQTVYKATGKLLTPAEAKIAVADYRRLNPAVLELWAKLDRALWASLGEGVFTMKLPSGRVITYENLHQRGDQIFYTQPTGMVKSVWGGSATAHLVSGTARDAFGECWLRSLEAGIPWVLPVHDEGVAEVESDVTAEDLRRCFNVTPEWLEGCPIASKAFETQFYYKD